MIIKYLIKKIIITSNNYNYNKFILNTSIAISAMILKRDIIKINFLSKNKLFKTVSLNVSF